MNISKRRKGASRRIKKVKPAPKGRKAASFPARRKAAPVWMIREKLKQRCIEYKSGSCKHCGITDGCTAIYDFHHREEDNDYTSISKLLGRYANEYNLALSIDGKLQTELDKCDLLCSNCHRKLHDKLKAECRSNGSPIWKQDKLKGRPTKTEQRSAIMKQLSLGKPIKKIAEQLELSLASVYAMIARIKADKTI